MQKPDVIFLMGPTCSGKTDLAIECARRYPVDLINVDSAQVYRGMDIGTAKPSPDVLAAYPHQLIDICDPSEPYSAADFCRDAKAAIAQSHARGRIPLLVGGTMLYFKALQDGLSPLPESDPAIREALAQEARALGWPALHARLANLDPVLFERLKPNDAQRISRALEVHAMTGKPLSEWQQQAGEGLPGSILAIGLLPQDRAQLHARIEQRFDAMMAEGFVAEARTLFAHPALHADLPAIKSVGYRQAFAYLSGEYDVVTFREKSIAATRQLAKRQITWLRSWPHLHIFDPFSSDFRSNLNQVFACLA